MFEWKKAAAEDATSKQIDCNAHVFQPFRPLCRRQRNEFNATQIHASQTHSHRQATDTEKS